MLLALCAGCVEYTEEIWLNRDMSGTIRMNIIVNEMIANLTEEAGRSDSILSEEGARLRFSNLEGIRLTDVKAQRDSLARIISITLDFDTLESLRNISNATKETNFLGDISVRPLEDGRFLFTRNVVMNDDDGNLVADKMLSDFTWMYTLHLPGRLVEANVPTDNIDYDHNTVTWLFSLALLAQGPEKMQVIFEAPRHGDPLKEIGLMALIATAVVGIGYAVVVRVKRSTSPAAGSPD